MAQFDLGAIVAHLKADTSDFKKGLNQAQKQSGEFKTGLQKVGDVSKKVAIATAAVGASLALVAKNSVDFTKQYVMDSKKIARETGMSIYDSSRLIAVTRKLGIETDQASVAFGVFSKRIIASSKDSKTEQIARQKMNLDIKQTEKDLAATNKQIKTTGDKSGKLKDSVAVLNNQLADLKDKLSQTSDPFASLGINVKDAQGRIKPFNELLLEVADKFKTLPNGVDKTALAMQLFGRGGKDFIKILDLGSQGITDLEKAADKLGVTLTPKTVNSISAMVQSQKDLQESTDALKISIGTATAPILTEFNQKLNEALTWLLQVNPAVSNVAASLIAFGGPVLTATATVAGLAANIAQVAGSLGRARLAALAFGAVRFTGILAAASLVVLGFQKITNVVKAAADAVNNSLGAAESAGNSMDDAIRKIKASKLSKSEKAKRIRSLSTGAVPRAVGGGVFPGKAYMVGEHEPEMFTPKTSGDITPLSKMPAGVTTNIYGTINIGSEVDADNFLKRLTRNSELARMGLSSS